MLAELLGTLLGKILQMNAPIISEILANSLKKAFTQSAEDGAVEEKLTRDLNKKITDWKKTIPSLLLLAGVFLLSGCATRTIYVPPGQPVRLADTIHNIPVWVKDSKGVLVKGRATLSEGWYCLPHTPSSDD